MSAPRPFPSLPSESNSRATSPAPSESTGGASAPRSSKKAAEGSGSKTQGSRPRKQDGKRAQGRGGQSRKSQAKKTNSPAVAVAAPPAADSTRSQLSSDSGEPKVKSNKSAQSKKQKPQSSVGANADAEAENKQQQGKRSDQEKKKQDRRSAHHRGSNKQQQQQQQQKKNSDGSNALLAEESKSAEAPVPTPAVLLPPAPAPDAAAVEVGLLAPSSNLLPQAMIVAGENGRARVLFNPPSEQVSSAGPLQGIQQQQQRVNGMAPHRASASASASASVSQFSSRAKYPAQFADATTPLGFGATQPFMHPNARVYAGLRAVSASHAPTTPLSAPAPFAPGTRAGLSPAAVVAARQRSVSSAQFGNPLLHPTQPRRLSSATASVPESIPAGSGAVPRGRSQSVSSHISMTGLRISMAQSRPGNVLAPHVPLLSRSGLASGAVQANTYANGGYFATRRASVSNVGLAVDPSHSIRIPAIMFQKPGAEELPPSSATATENAPRSSVSTSSAEAAGPSTPATPARQMQQRPGSEEGAGGNESLAMRRLQDMISSMRALGHPQQQSAQSTKTPSSDVAAAGKVDALPPISLPPTPAAHPTSRFDSILEEDEDDEDDEDELEDGEIADDSSATATNSGSSAQRTASHTLDSQSKQQAHILFAL
ncbi:hypothetical protein GQ54DRAFT_78304 [Martensiomyces pterosporus]|nr:hypothetical protein GQ54DRAFT_78304 [Martensiomyces pterosporus]